MKRMCERQTIITAEQDGLCTYGFMINKLKLYRVLFNSLDAIFSFSRLINHDGEKLKKESSCGQNNANDMMCFSISPKVHILFDNVCNQ